MFSLKLASFDIIITEIAVYGEGNIIMSSQQNLFLNNHSS